MKNWPKVIFHSKFSNRPGLSLIMYGMNSVRYTQIKTVYVHIEWLLIRVHSIRLRGQDQSCLHPDYISRYLIQFTLRVIIHSDFVCYQ